MMGDLPNGIPVDSEPAFFFDLDGTLAELAARPDSVKVQTPVIAMLDRLSTAVDGAVAILSGRSIEQIDALIAPLLLPAAGLHGGELRFPGGRRLRFEPSPYIRSVVKGGISNLVLPPGAWVEDKAGIAFALHHREAVDAGDALFEAAQRIASQTHGGYTVLRGDCVVEVLPAGRSKGTALRRLMETDAFRERVPVVLGDDHTDEDAFVEAKLWEGTAIGVGLRESATADVQLCSPGAVHAWLAEVTAEMESRSLGRRLGHERAA